MTIIHGTTIIEAPIEVCFHLFLSIDLELSSAQRYEIQAIDGVTKGFIGLGQRVTWKVKQFKICLTHTSEITRLEPPFHFQDVMVSGIFRSFRHDHFFRGLSPRRTEMRDELTFSFPAFLLGALTERLVVEPRLTEFLAARNALIKHQAESGV
jgi:ligand-binding SRPBCC domain-containing protein